MQINPKTTIRLILTLGFFIISIGSSIGSSTGPSIGNVRAIYMTASTVNSSRFEELADALVESGGNAVVMDIEIGGGQLAFVPENEFLKTINPGRDFNDYKAKIKILHDKGIYAIARQVVFN